MALRQPTKRIIILGSILLVALAAMVYLTVNSSRLKTQLAALTPRDDFSELLQCANTAEIEELKQQWRVALQEYKAAASTAAEAGAALDLREEERAAAEAFWQQQLNTYGPEHEETQRADTQLAAAQIAVAVAQGAYDEAQANAEAAQQRVRDLADQIHAACQPATTVEVTNVTTGAENITLPPLVKVYFRCKCLDPEHGQACLVEWSPGDQCQRPHVFSSLWTRDPDTAFLYVDKFADQACAGYYINGHTIDGLPLNAESENAVTGDCVVHQPPI